MKKLCDKLKDRRGASILLALLFFLVCCMVGASILMAAASNAGKIRSSREEQQKYLALSSALRLVCDELAETTYYGKYEVDTITIPDTEDDQGNTVSGYSYQEYTQKSGEFKCGLSEVLPLLRELDGLFAATFPSSGSGASQNDDIYVPLRGALISAPEEHVLTLQVDTSGAEGPDGLGDMVTVRARMDEKYSIRLTATLGTSDGDGYIYTMEAQLMPSGTIPNMGAKRTGPVSWTLAWIAKKEAGDDT